MAIVKPAEMNFSNKNIIMIISGLPGTGKTTLALSAPDVLLIDADEGLARVAPAHRKDASICKTFDEVKADIASAKGQYKTIVVDTGGALVDMLKQYVLDHPDEYSGGAKKSGGISLQGFGFVKQLFLDFSKELRRDFNVIYIFHESMDKQNDGVFYNLVCEGAARTLVYQPADLAAHLMIQNGKRVLGFTPTEEYSAKSAYGIKGLVTVPELKEGEPNDFLTKLFAKVRDNLAEETASLAPQQKAYEEIMAQAPAMMEAITDALSANQFASVLNSMDHALTSKKELGAMYKARCKEIGLTWDGKQKAWVVGDAKQ